VPATPDQLAARADAATARAALAAGEREALAALTQVRQAQEAVDAAEAAGDEAAVREARARLAAATARAGGWPEQRREGETDLAQARAEALAGGTGFELLDPELPVLLLPVRVETRYAFANADASAIAFEPDGGLLPVLLVRVFPDDVHVAAHDGELTPLERRLQRQFAARIRAARDFEPWLAAWIDLVGGVGPTRAAYLAHTMEQPPSGLRPSAWSRAPRAALLPDRFVAFAWTSDGAPPVRTAAPQLVREPLPLGPDPLDGGGPAGAGLAWIRNFSAALKAGLALAVPLPAEDAEVERLIVIGVRGSLDGEASATALHDLLAAHHYVAGLGFLASGAATSSLPGERAAYRSRPAADELYPVELGYLLWRNRLESPPQCERLLHPRPERPDPARRRERRLPDGGSAGRRP
jgi:hypothetical protein